MFFRRQSLCMVLALGCAGCCTFNACIDDLAFTSLTRPDPSGQQDSNARGDSRRLRFKPGYLNLRFSTKLDVFRLQEHNDGFGSTLVVTLCDDTSGFVGFGQVYTEDGWTTDASSYDNKYTRHVATVTDPQLPPTPSLSRAADGRITYESPIQIVGVMHSVRDPRFGSLTGQFTPLPSDPHRFPNLCFSIGGGVFPGNWLSNTVVLPRDAVADVLSRLEPDRATQ